MVVVFIIWMLAVGSGPNGLIYFKSVFDKVSAHIVNSRPIRGNFIDAGRQSGPEARKPGGVHTTGVECGFCHPWGRRGKRGFSDAR